MANQTLSGSTIYNGPLTALVNSSYKWLDGHIKSFIKRFASEVAFIEDLEQSVANDERPFLQFRKLQYRDFTTTMRNPKTSMTNVYPHDEALTRKSLLSRIVRYWVAKHPKSRLQCHVPLTVELRLDYREYLEESFAEAEYSYDLCQSLDDNYDKSPEKREWWILKPSLTDCGDYIRLFSTREELADCLESVKSPDTDDDEHTTRGGDDGGVVPSSRLRDFVAQKYLVDVVLLNDRKFHIRAYILAIGRVKVFVYQELLVLTASESYQQPWTDARNLKAALTNTNLHSDSASTEESVQEFWSAKSELPKQKIFEQIQDISGELFLAAHGTMSEKFVLLPGCFEVFAADFLVDTQANVWLLEVNSGPAFYQDGVGGAVALRFWESVVWVAVKELSGMQVNGDHPAGKRMIETLNENLAGTNIREILFT